MDQTKKIDSNLPFLRLQEIHYLLKDIGVGNIFTRVVKSRCVHKKHRTTAVDIIARHGNIARLGFDFMADNDIFVVCKKVDELVCTRSLSYTKLII